MRLTRELLNARSAAGKSLADRFHSHLAPEGDCLVWTGSRKSNGYGQIGYTRGTVRKALYAHRVAWAVAEGVLEDADLVLHRCDNPPCVKREHLFLGTHKSNSDDKIAKGRFNPGAPRPPTDPRKVALIQRLRAAGLRAPGIGLAVGLSATQVRNILRKYGKSQP